MHCVAETREILHSELLAQLPSLCHCTTLHIVVTWVCAIAKVLSCWRRQIFIRTSSDSTAEEKRSSWRHERASKAQLFLWKQEQNSCFQTCLLILVVWFWSILFSFLTSWLGLQLNSFLLQDVVTYTHPGVERHQTLFWKTGSEIWECKIQRNVQSKINYACGIRGI